MARESVCHDVVEALVMETVQTLPDSLLGSCRNLTGRRPSDLTQSVARIAEKLDDGDALIFIRDIVDATVFSVLGLVDAGFKDLNVETRFDRSTSTVDLPDDPLLDLYRERVDPGGVVAG